VDDNSKPTIFVCYGFCEGPRIGRHFIHALQNAGFRTVQSAQQADIFIGHSGGCLRLPRKSNARLAVLIGLPYWPDRSLIRTLYKKNRHEHTVSRESGTELQWWVKFWWNSFYFWNMRQNLPMKRAMSRGIQTPAVPTTLCIRNRGDDCCIETIWQLPALTNSAFVSIPGEHDDLWMHPELYAAIIKAYYGASILAPTETK
jgi:hypothetical protein